LELIFQYGFKVFKIRKEKLKMNKEENLKEFIFSTYGGFRYFIVLGYSLENAEINFVNTPLEKRGYFELKDLPIRKLKSEF
jgi:hypothetical protein